MRFAFGLLLTGALLTGCDADRITKLEKENADLRAKLETQSHSMNLDLQAKCSKDARAWFSENWQRDKDTILLDFTNHYQSTLNKCFVLVEYHYRIVGSSGSSWTNHVDLNDVYENSKYAEFAENHYTFLEPDLSTKDEVITCNVQGQKCKTNDEFYRLVGRFMND